jgi:hypothetical protein
MGIKRRSHRQHNPKPRATERGACRVCGKLFSLDVWGDVATHAPASPETSRRGSGRTRRPICTGSRKQHVAGTETPIAARG